MYVLYFKEQFKIENTAFTFLLSLNIHVTGNSVIFY